MICAEAGKRLRSTGVFVGLMLTALLCVSGLQAQSADQKSVELKAAQGSEQIFFLTNATRVMDLNDMQTELRNMLPRARIYGVQSQNAIVVQGSAEDVAAARKSIAELDRARKVYRVTYTISESDGGKRVGAEHYAVIVSPGGKATLKRGSRVPIVTGTAEAATPNANNQVQYVDVGLSIEASLDGDSLHSKVEQTSVAEEKSSVGAQDPIVRQTVVDGASRVVVGKTVVLGALDIPGGARHEEVEVAVELVP
jgi:type II secretory pathway component GspD/PulD (secretin)